MHMTQPRSIRPVGPGLPVDIQAAGLLRRLAALCYDSLLLLGPVAIYGFIVALTRQQAGLPAETAWGSLGLVFIPAAFFCWFWTHGGQTLGMTAWRLKLVTQTGGPLSWRHAIVRFCAAWLSIAALGMGFWWALFDRNKQTWHDQLAGTFMQRVPKPPTPR